MKNINEILIIGAGPAGLTAAWEAEKHGVKTLILEGDKEVGGISRPVERNGWRFDIGGHRFFTKVDEVYKVLLNFKKDNLFGSLLIPSKKFLARFSFRPWKGVYISDKNLNSLENIHQIFQNVYWHGPEHT